MFNKQFINFLLKFSAICTIAFTVVAFISSMLIFVSSLGYLERAVVGDYFLVTQFVMTMATAIWWFVTYAFIGALYKYLNDEK